MKSRTSFSKLTTFRKDITRFAPVWVLYFVGLMLWMMEALSHKSYDHVAYNIPNMISSFGVVNLIYAAVIAVMLFGDLYNTRLCYSLHSLPQRRESWLLSHICAGVLFALVPNVAATLVLALSLESYWFLSLYWLLAVMLQFVFFFGVAVVSALLVGNRFAALLVYAGLNFVSLLAYWLVETVYMPLLKGVVLDIASFVLLSPAVELFRNSFMNFASVRKPGPYGGYEIVYDYEGLAEGWGYVAVLAVIGLVLMGVGVWLYRKRHLESAGDFVAFAKLNGPACLVMTLCVAGVMAFIGEEIVGSNFLLWFAVGLVIGWFGSRMLLERRLRVFRVRAFVGLGVLAAVLTGSFLLMEHDVFRIKNFVPEVEAVQRVTIADYQMNGQIYGHRITVTLADPEQIQDITVAHQDILTHLDDNTVDERYSVTIRYELKDGRTVQRFYRPTKNTKNYWIVQGYFRTPENILGYGGQNWGDFVDSIREIRLSGNTLPKSCYKQVLGALREDCAKGAVTTAGSKDSIAWMELRYVGPGGQETWRTLHLDAKAQTTLELLRKPEVLFGTNDAQVLTRGMTYLVINGTNVDKSHWPALAEALLKDCRQGLVQVHHDGNTLHTIEFAVENEQGYFYNCVYIDKLAENTLNYYKEHDVTQPLQ